MKNVTTITVEHDLPEGRNGRREITVTHTAEGGIVLSVEDAFDVAVAEIPPGQVDEFRTAVNMGRF